MGKGGRWLRVAGCGLRVAGCGLRVAGCGLRVAGCGLRVAGCGLRNLISTTRSILIENFRPPSSVPRSVDTSRRSDRPLCRPASFSLQPSVLVSALRAWGLRGVWFRWLTPPAEDVPAQGPGAEGWPKAEGGRMKAEGCCNRPPATDRRGDRPLRSPNNQQPTTSVPRPPALLAPISGAIVHSVDPPASAFSLPSLCRPCGPGPCFGSTIPVAHATGRGCAGPRAWSGRMAKG